MTVGIGQTMRKIWGLEGTLGRRDQSDRLKRTDSSEAIALNNGA